MLRSTPIHPTITLSPVWSSNFYEDGLEKATHNFQGWDPAQFLVYRCEMLCCNDCNFERPHNQYPWRIFAHNIWTGICHSHFDLYRYTMNMINPFLHYCNHRFRYRNSHICNPHHICWTKNCISHTPWIGNACGLDNSGHNPLCLLYETTRSHLKAM